MAPTSPRLLRRVARDFAPEEQNLVIEPLKVLAESLSGWSIDQERVQAAVVIAAQGDYQEFRNQLAVAHADWRDVLVNGGLEDRNWPRKLNQELGSKPWRRTRRV